MIPRTFSVRSGRYWTRGICKPARENQEKAES
jgi:hypothetical protein